MRRLILLALAAILTGGVSLAAASRASAAGEPQACGQPNQPPCPPEAQQPNKRKAPPPGQAPGQPPRGQQGAPESQKQPPASRKQPPSQQAQPPAKSKQPPAREAQPPAARKQPPPYEAQPPAARKQPPPQEAQPPATRKQPPPYEAQPPAGRKQSPPYEAQPPASRNQPPPYGAQPPGAARMPPPVMHQPYIPDNQRHWSRGEKLPPRYREGRYAINDWRGYNLPRPPAGYTWYCQRGGNCFLVASSTGTIRRVWWRDDRDRYWRHRYTRLYGYNDDYYYRECRSGPDPAGVIVGGLIGGLLGSAVSGEDQAGAVFAGVIVGAAMGAILSNDMDCEDQSYAYRTYYDGLNSGVPGRYSWSNPYNRHYGDFVVMNYYDDPDGFYCAKYRQTTWIGGRGVTGSACRQPDGAWVFLR